MNVYKSFSPNEPVVSSYLKLCTTTSTTRKNKKLGKCALFGNVNLIDGEVEYKFISDVRPALCNGKYFEKKDVL